MMRHEGTGPGAESCSKGSGFGRAVIAKRMAGLALMAFIVGVSVGCAGQIRMYEGPERPLRELALIRSYYIGWEVVARAVDGKETSRGWAAVLPGRHVVDLLVSKSLGGGWVAAGNSQVTIDAKAGFRYKFAASTTPPYRIEVIEEPIPQE
jgi:hypothetical protein